MTNEEIGCAMYGGALCVQVDTASVHRRVEWLAIDRRWTPAIAVVEGPEPRDTLDAVWNAIILADVRNPARHCPRRDQLSLDRHARRIASAIATYQEDDEVVCLVIDFGPHHSNASETWKEDFARLVLDECRDLAPLMLLHAVDPEYRRCVTSRAVRVVL